MLSAKCQFCALNTFRENVWTNRQTNKQTNKQTNRTKIIYSPGTGDYEKKHKVRDIEPSLKKKHCFCCKKLKEYIKFVGYAKLPNLSKMFTYIIIAFKFHDTMSKPSRGIIIILNVFKVIKIYIKNMDGKQRKYWSSSFCDTERSHIV